MDSRKSARYWCETDKSRMLPGNLQKLVEHGIECLLLGGQISRSFAYMEAALHEGLRDVTGLTRIAPAEHISEAAFYGLLAQADDGC